MKFLAKRSHPDGTPRNVKWGIIVLVLFSVIAMLLAYRPTWNEGEQFIGHADAANLAQVARNIAETGEPVSNNRWLLRGGGVPGNEVTHVEEYWPLYPSYFLAIFYKIFGANTQVSMLTTAILKIVSAFLIFYLVLLFARSTTTAVVASWAVLFFLHGFNRKWLELLSDTFLEPFLLATIVLWILAIRSRHWLLYLLTGFFTGVAAGMKPSGLLLIGFIPFFWIYCTNRWSTLKHSLWALPLGLVVGLGPYMLTLFTAYDQVTPPGGPIAREAAKIRRHIMNTQGLSWEEAHDIGFYDPGPYDLKESDSQFPARVIRGAQNARDHLEGWILGSWMERWVILIVFFGLCFCLRDLYRAPKERMSSHFLLPALVAAMSIASCALALYVHHEPRYIYAIAGPLYLAYAIAVVSRISLVALLLPIGLLSMTIIPWHLNATPDYVHSSLQMADELLPEKAKVMTFLPWEFAFHTRNEAVHAPCTFDTNVLWNTAYRFGVDYIVIHQKTSRHAMYYPLQDGAFPNYLEKVYFDEDLAIGRFKWENFDFPNGTKTRGVATPIYNSALGKTHPTKGGEAALP